MRASEYKGEIVIELSMKELRPGQTLGRAIYRPSGEVLLSKGFTLTHEVINRLQEIGQSRYWIQEAGLEHITPEEILPEFLLFQASEELRINAEHFRKKAKVQDNINIANFDPKAMLKDTARFTDSLLSSRILKVARTISKEFRKNKLPFLLHFTSVRTQANYMFQHAVDAAVVAAAIGRTFQFEEEELEHLVLGTMLMDIGTLLLPWSLVIKPDRLTFAEFCALKEHPTFGFEILRLDPLIPLICAHIAFQHHERMDGGGYPRRLIGYNNPPLKQEINDKRSIHRFAEIVAVADEYMSLVQPRPFAPPKSPVESIKFLLKASGNHLNSAVVDALIPMIPIYSVGSRVLIIAAHQEKMIGATAVISKTNIDRQDRPEITLLYDSEGNWIEHEIIAMETNSQVMIQQASMAN